MTEQQGRLIYNKTFSNQEDRELWMPIYYCAVCVRLLFEDERCGLNKEDFDEIEIGINGRQSWPIFSYKDRNNMPIIDFSYTKSGKVATCTNHSSKGTKSNERIINFINFININWCYPGVQDPMIRNLHPSAEGFLSPIVVFCELTNSRSRLTKATRAGHHFVSGRIGLYKSNDYLGSHVGTRGMTKLSSKKDISSVDRLRIRMAWEWMKSYHPLIKNLAIDDPSDLTDMQEDIIIQNYENNYQQNENRTKFQAYQMMPVDGGGPKTADERYRMEDMAIGMLGNERKLVKYSNPCLLGYLFPMLYPEGRGFFSIDYPGIASLQGLEFFEGKITTTMTLEQNKRVFMKGRSGQVNSRFKQSTTAILCTIEVDEVHVRQEEDIDDGDISWSESGGSSDDEDERNRKAPPKKKSRAKTTDEGTGYSQFTLKAYAKFRLLGVDRRFGRNIKFILMMFDWIQKWSVFGYQMRTAPSTIKGKPTTVANILERSSNGKGTKYRESSTVPIPASIRTGAKYKRSLFLKFSALFEKYGTPQLFGTYTCDAESPGQKALAIFAGGEGSKTHDDPVLFTVHWRRQWTRFFEFMTKVWASRRTGGLEAWCWVFEMQDRGTPHTHFCLWTKNSLKQLMKDSVITCSRSGKTEEQSELIRKHQVHRSPCGRYCKPNGEDHCRFGYPKPLNPGHTYFDEEKKKFVLERHDGDEYIVGYNMELLRFGRVNMDLQYNVGSHAKKYMCKYITKQAGTKKATIIHEKDSESGARTEGQSAGYVQNFHFRSVGVVEAIMDICGFRMSGCSQKSIFLPTDLPENRRKVVKRKSDLDKMRGDDTNVFYDDKWLKYLIRPRNTEESPDFESMTYRDYFANFEEGTRATKQVYLNGDNRRIFEKSEGLEALVRTRSINATKSEDAFMHLLMLHHATRRDVDKWIGKGEEFKTYQEMAEKLFSREFISKHAPGLLVVIDHGPVTLAAKIQEDHRASTKDFEWTKDQDAVISKVNGNIRRCKLLVTGAAGTGKSAVLEKIYKEAKRKGYHPIVLAPSGVAAVNVGGETIHRWFRISKMGGQDGFPLCNSHAIREKLIDIQETGKKPFFLVDEVSMISGTLFSAMSKALQDASLLEDHSVFGGYPVVLFGDYGQLSPISKGRLDIDWIWKAEEYNAFERMDLITQCRQAGDVEFKEMLDCVRKGEMNSKAYDILLSIMSDSKETVLPDFAVHLMPHKATVATINEKKLKSLPGEIWRNEAQDDAGTAMDEGRKKGIEMETGLLTTLELKVGARVMCTSNIDVRNGLVNGTLGVVVAIYGHEVVEILTKEERTFRISPEYRNTSSDGHERRQFPVVLAWAMTIHKSQSLTLDKVVVHLERSFTSGQAYVAMSRVRNREDLYIKDVSPESITRVSHAVKSRLTQEKESSRSELDQRIEDLEEKLEVLKANKKDGQDIISEVLLNWEDMFAQVDATTRDDESQESDNEWCNFDSGDESEWEDLTGDTSEEEVGDEHRETIGHGSKRVFKDYGLDEELNKKRKRC